ncbi:glycogen debranching N-terminal domain-containing protein [Streptomyces sp. NPDC050560]|uniref:amylo-alpha-1,6-glucosidase n=1 Tax=Streptomyces sp. NPDC050560 TaxID=3365630 RepID=UPI0037B2F748
MNAPRALLVHDGAFAALDGSRDITGAASRSPDGLFVRDARHLSRWQVTLDGAAPTVLVPAHDEDAIAVLNPEGTRDEPPACTLLRTQALHGGRLVERLRLLSNVPHDTVVTLALTADADFADQFELRADHRHYPKPGAHRTATATPEGVTFDYRREDWHARTVVTAQPPPAVTPADREAPTARLLTWRLTLPGHGSAEVRVDVTAHAPGAPEGPPPPEGPEAAAALVRAERRAFTAAPLPAPADGGAGEGGGHYGVEQGGEESAEEGGQGGGDLGRACAVGLADLARLLVPATGVDGESVRVPGAGVPWFLTLFGRDALLTSFFALPYRPGLAAATLGALAAAQATADEPERVAQPGKIVHEVRHGELARFGQVPYGRYYGSVDSTPLFLALLGAHARQTGDPAHARRLERHARAAVDWMFRHGGLDDHGYLVYEADGRGLLNQNWKDSAGAICFRDGTHATGAVAVAEVQGYAYDALRESAGLARAVWGDPVLARRLDGAARGLRERFTADFLPGGAEVPALALDGARRPVDAPASDAGHLLWSGILDRASAVRVGRRLLRPDFFSGWGVRTLAAGVPAYHPLSYHRGSIWPHDNAVTVLGLARYGLHAEAALLSRGLLDASAHFGHRLPEVIAGYARPPRSAAGPVPYPHANSPQAWAAATPLALLTAARAAGRRGT